ncbi:MAG: hypothetical protein IJK98_00930 [Clostridia bacterium]|nr:hypothetical protein [Clostridia bacterium]
MKTAEQIKRIRQQLAEKIGRDKKPLVIVALGVLGMVCLLLPAGGGKTAKKEPAADVSQAQAAIAAQLESLLKTVEGVGRVKVYVTVDRLQRTVYAVNTEQTSEEDRSAKNEKYVFVEAGNDTQGLPLYEVTPEIRGVAVCCEGGGSGVVRQEVTRLIGAALGIAANRIYVTKMQS